MLASYSKITIKEYLDNPDKSIEEIIRCCYSLPDCITVPEMLTNTVRNQLYILNDVAPYMTLKSQESQFIDICPTVNPTTRGIEYTILLHNLTITKVGKLYSLSNNSGPILSSFTHEDFVRSFELFEDLQNYESLPRTTVKYVDYRYEFKKYLFRREYFVTDDTPEFKFPKELLDLISPDIENTTIFGYDPKSRVCLMADHSNAFPDDELSFRLVKVFRIGEDLQKLLSGFDRLKCITQLDKMLYSKRTEKNTIRLNEYIDGAELLASDEFLYYVQRLTHRC